MDQVEEVRERLVREFPARATAAGTPGAQVAVLADGEIVDAAAGVLSRATNVDVTTDAVFRLGSVTKLCTATLVMQLVDEGKLDLDLPVKRWLPEFRVADAAASEVITARQLLCHTAGFDGELYADTGRGDDAVQRVVAELVPTLSQMYPPGRMFSYSNAGYCVLGRLVEVMRGMPYGQALREFLVRPLGLRHVATDAEEAVLLRAAVGHVGTTRPSPIWAACHGEAPAGALLAMSARDLLTIVKAHLAGGVGPDGAQALSRESALAMRQPAARSLPRCGSFSWYGLGWYLADLPDGRVLALNGMVVRQWAFLRVAPEQGVAVALFTNGGNGVRLARETAVPVFEELTGIRLQEDRTPVLPGSTPVQDADRYVGRYRNRVCEAEVRADADGRLWLSQRFRRDALSPRISSLVWDGHITGELRRLEGDEFGIALAGGGVGAPCAFLGSDPRGRAELLHKGTALPRVGATTVASE
jgi:CubicO group peptidase (beta-lactamase class C family)